MERIPILKMGQYLLVTIQVDMHDRLALTLQEDLTSQIVRHRSRGVLIDISSLEMVDSFIGRMLGTITSMARLLDAARRAGAVVKGHPNRARHGERHECSSGRSSRNNQAGWQ